MKQDQTSASHDELMKEAWRRKHFDRLRELINVDFHENTSSPITFYYAGLITEHGLNVEKDANKAKEFYRDSFNDGKGVLRAGINLARLLLSQNETKESFAVYKRIIEADRTHLSEEDLTTIKLAQYHLARSRAEFFIDFHHNLSKKQNDEISKIIEDYDGYLNSENIHPVSRANALISKAKILTRLQDDKINSQDFREIKTILSQANNIYHTQGITDNTVKNLLFDVQIKEILAISGNSEYELAIQTCTDVLATDNNIHVKLLKSKLLLEKTNKTGVFNQQDFDEAITLTREVLKQNPTNKSAINLLDTLQKQLTRRIIVDVTSKLIEQTSDLDKDAWLKGKAKEQRENYLNNLGVEIANIIKHSPYIQEFAKSANEGEIAEDICRLILKGHKKEIAEEISGSSKEPGNKLKSAIRSLVISYSPVKSKEFSFTTAEQREDLREKRAIFRTALVDNLIKYYDGYRKFIDEADPKKKGNLKEMQRTLLAGVIPLSGITTGTLFFMGPSDIRSVSDDLKLGILYNRALEFCKIGNNSTGASSTAVAVKHFEEIADTVLKEYGTQIDKVQLLDIDSFARAATDKMVHHVRNITNLEQITTPLSSSIASPQVITAGTIQSRLIEGLRTGKTEAEEHGLRTEIHTTKTSGIRKGSTSAEDLLNIDIITNNGIDFYSPTQPTFSISSIASGAPQKVYRGIRVVDKIPANYSSVNLPREIEEAMQRDYQRNVEIESNPSLDSTSRSIQSVSHGSSKIQPYIKEANTANDHDRYEDFYHELSEIRESTRGLVSQDPKAKTAAPKPVNQSKSSNTQNSRFRPALF